MQAFDMNLPGKRSFFLFALIVLLSGCAAPYPRVSPDFQKEWQHQQYTAQAYLLPSASIAFAERLNLIQQATQTIDITYFSWNGDTLGLMLLNALKEAADRGVIVRIALDDLLVFNEKWLADIDSHENIDIRLFNPFSSRKMGWMGRSIEFSINQQQLDNRLHEKYFNVDQQFLILGGRNIGDEYFGYSQTANFFDLDVLFKGPLITAFANNYQRLWESGLLTPISTLIDVESDGQFKYFKQRYQKTQEKNVAIVEDLATTLATLPVAQYTEVQVIPVFDSLNKLQDSQPYFRSRAEHIIAKELSDAQHAIISTPYIVPTDGEFVVLSQLTSNGADVRLATNSSASNDSLFVPAYYETHRETLLDMGINIVEYKDQAKNSDNFYHADTYYHNKTIVLDSEVSYIGSSNFDPRSDFINIEFGLFVYSEPFALQIQDYLFNDKDELYWRVLRNKSGQVEWHSGDEIHHQNPNYGGWHSLPDWFFRKMNAESEL
ncbi:phospholipase D family protein [Psychromonas marina]|uniref:Phospholipase D family protein n=1 Tax=Psychromonas marina TaxID=88364 RepID=A0ABQ6E0W7_9GAMM|nr:phospholipase D family protein [Psychromonas marina]GLS90793.1 phospholipase D family protein [Psychromonas marina]